jgi:hypothetical protein
MDEVIRPERAESVSEELDAIKVALIKGMILRGDRQSDIAAFFKVNSRVVSHVNTNHYPDYVHIRPAQPDKLPPADYPSPYELLEAQQALWKARVALEAAHHAVRDALDIVRKAETRGPVSKFGGRR